ncbi:hypothetical protein FH972_020454 [Carpinus fangiana]|uniref:Uncharacterized protein n=1 Tax=Carpinus fangiana TaxID=176857 RepID=A0A5N6RTI7_9ROSI|nr:hypothetical protein FH972_020454 [Carpinus fangiana]
MSNQRQKSPLPENSAEEDQQEEEDKKLQEPSQEPTTGGDERKVATLPLFPLKTSIAREGPILKPCAANAMGSDPIKEMIYSTLASFKEGNIPRMPLELKLTDFKAKSLQASKNLDSPRLPLRTPDKRPFENYAKDGFSQGKEKNIKDKVHGEDGEGEEDKNLQEPSQEPTGGGGDEGKVATRPPSAQNTSIARNGPVREPYVANLMRVYLWKQVTQTVRYSRVSNFKAMSLQASKKFDSPRQPLGTAAERPFENYAKDGFSQGKEKKIKDKVHGEEEEEDKNLQEPSQEPTGGGDERKVPFLPPSAQKTSIARKGPILKPCAGNAMGSDPMKEIISRAIHDALASLGVPVPDPDAEEEDSDSIMFRRAVYFSNHSRPASNINLLDSLPLPSGTPAERPLENSAKDGVSQPQGKEKMIKDKVEGEDGEGEGGGEENPRDDSGSI